MLSKVLGNGPASLALFATMMFSMRVLGHPELLNEQWQKIAFFCVLTPIIYLVIALLIVSLYFVQDSLVKRLLSHRGLTWIGELSYSLYLWHTFAFLVIAKRITGHCAEIAGWLLAFLFAFISYYVIEQPFSHLRKRFRT
jgi:peptidoglycan/LPS O-acetylase OafA/YrhL